MDMNRTFRLRKEDRNPQWRVMDAQGQALGRLATQIANALRGKDQAMYTPHTDSGDYVVVINAAQVVLTGDKWNQKTYQRYSGYLGNMKTLTAKEVLARDPERIIMHAVKLMLPKNNLNRQVLKKLRIYQGAEHNHKAQVGA